MNKTSFDVFNAGIEVIISIVFFSHPYISSIIQSPQKVIRAANVY